MNAMSNKKFIAVFFSIVCFFLSVVDLRAEEELILDVQHINAADYPAASGGGSGTITAWMMLKFLGNGSDSHIHDLTISAPQALYDYARTIQPEGVFTANTIADVMNHFAIDPSYHYEVINGTNHCAITKEIAYWINRDIMDAEPYPVNTPAMIYFSDTYDHPVVVTGTVADEDPYQNYPDANIAGLWIDDPAIYDDPFMPVETNVFYSTEAGVMNNLDNFFIPMASGEYAGEYVAIVSNVVPEPSSMLLFGAGLLSLLGFKKRGKV